MSAFGNLSAPMSVHQQQARESVEVFDAQFSRFRQALDSRDCETAFRTLINMTLAVGSIEDGHLPEKLALEVVLAHVKVQESFKDACMRKSAGGGGKAQMLHGLKRRRRW